MSGSDSEPDIAGFNVFGPWHDPLQFGVHVALQPAALDPVIISSSEEHELDMDGVRRVCEVKLSRRIGTYTYSGAFLDAVFNEHRNPLENWGDLPQDEQDRRWIDNFRMREQDFDDLLNMAAPVLPDRQAPVMSYRAYTTRTQLLVTLHFLAHCHTLRSVAEKFGFPHNSISACCIKPGVLALWRVFFEDAQTKIIRFPRSEEGLKKLAQGFEAKHKLRGVIGSIDGTAIPQKKPTKDEAGGDTNCNTSFSVQNLGGKTILAPLRSPKAYMLFGCA
jgi:hypothetical protein